MRSNHARLRWAGPLIAIWATLLSVEILAMVGLFALERIRGITYDPIDIARVVRAVELTINPLIRGARSYVVTDSILGWTPRRGPAGFDMVTEADGARIPDSPSSPISAFGDSFVYGDEVPGEEAWPALLGIRNFGVVGYGFDQAYLRYMAVRPAARVVLLGFMSENIKRTVSAFRPFYTSGGPAFAKPRFVLRADSLILIPPPLYRLEDYAALVHDPGRALPPLGRYDYYWHERGQKTGWDVLATVRLLKLIRTQAIRTQGPLYGRMFRPGSEAFRLTVATFGAFAHAVESRHALPVIVLLPSHDDLDSGATYHSLRDTLTSRRYRVIDLWGAFESCVPHCDSAFRSYHYSPAGNRMVATYLESALRDIPGVGTYLPLKLPIADEHHIPSSEYSVDERRQRRALGKDQ